MANLFPCGILPPALRIRVPWHALPSLMIALTIGCSGQFEDRLSRARPPVFKTRGLVTWNGIPAPGATVSLHSHSHNVAATGITNDRGEFVLTTWRYGDGAVVGDHKVSVETLVPWNPAAPEVEYKNVMPAKYQNPETSGLTATISDRGPNTLSFDVVGRRAEVPPPSAQSPLR